MITLKRLNLVHINDVELKEKEMNRLFGGESCGCGCNQTSLTYTNANANWNMGYTYSSGGNKVCATWWDNIWKNNFN